MMSTWVHLCCMWHLNTNKEGEQKYLYFTCHNESYWKIDITNKHIVKLQELSIANVKQPLGGNIIVKKTKTKKHHMWLHLKQHKKLKFSILQGVLQLVVQYYFAYQSMKMTWVHTLNNISLLARTWIFWREKLRNPLPGTL